MRKIVSIGLTVMLMTACATTKFKSNWDRFEIPALFSVRFETSKGNFEVKIERRLSPKAVDRFYQLVKTNYFENTLFYRVNPGFVAQFGGNNKIIYQRWGKFKVPDEPVVQGNYKGTLSFARGGKNSRGRDLFINLNDNNRLDTLHYNDVTGFPTFGKVTIGMEVLEALYDNYADTTMNNLDLMYKDLDDFIKKYPKLDTIYRAKLIK